MIFKGIMIEIHKHHAYVEAENETEANQLLEALQKENYEIWHHEEGNMGSIVGIESVETPPVDVYVNSDKDLEDHYWVCANCNKRMKGGFIKGKKHYCSIVCYKIIEGKYPEDN
jgi:hypothetical protein